MNERVLELENEGSIEQRLVLLCFERFFERQGARPSAKWTCQ